MKTQKPSQKPSRLIDRYTPEFVPPEPFDVLAAMPAEGFFPKYVQYAGEVTDAPLEFHLGAALAVLAATVARKAHVQITLGKRTITVPLNLWVMLVGDSTTRKNSTCERALRLYTGEVAPTGGSTEAVFTWVAKRPDTLFWFPELTRLFQTNGFASFLCQMYDGETFRRMLMVPKQPTRVLEIEITKPYTTLLACASPAMLRSVVAKPEWLGGVFGRMLPLYGTRERFNVFGGARNDATEAQLRTFLLDIDDVCIKLTENALVVYKTWSQEMDVALQTRSEHVKGALQRLPDHVLRVAGLYAISCRRSTDDSGLLSVDSDLMTRAITLGNYAAKTIDKLSRALSPDPVVRNMFVLRNVLERMPKGMSLRDVQDITGTAWRTLEAAATSMCEAGELEVTVDTATKQKWVRLIGS